MIDEPCLVLKDGVDAINVKRLVLSNRAHLGCWFKLRACCPDLGVLVRAHVGRVWLASYCRFPFEIAGRDLEIPEMGHTLLL